MIREIHSTAYQVETDQAARGLSDMVSKLQQTATAADKAEHETEQFQAAARQGGAAAQSASSGISQMVSQLNSVKGAIMGGAGAVFALSAMRRAARAVAAELTATVDASLKLETIQRTARLTRADLGFLADEADRLGISFEKNAQRFGTLNISFRQAGLGARDAQEAITSIAEAGVVLGLSAQDQELALTAIDQIASKNVVSMEELRQQLGERIPGALGLMAQGLGVTTAELVDMVASGDLLAKDALPALFKAMRETFGPEVNSAIEGRIAAIERFKNEIFLLRAAIGDQFPIGELNNALAETVRLFREGAAGLDSFLGPLDEVVGATIRWVTPLESVSRSLKFMADLGAQRREVDKLTESIKEQTRAAIRRADADARRLGVTSPVPDALRRAFMPEIAVTRAERYAKHLMTAEEAAAALAEALDDLKPPPSTTELRIKEIKRLREDITDRIKEAKQAESEQAKALREKIRALREELEARRQMEEFIEDAPIPRPITWDFIGTPTQEDVLSFFDDLRRIFVQQAPVAVPVKPEPVEIELPDPAISDEEAEKLKKGLRKELEEAFLEASRILGPALVAALQASDFASGLASVFRDAARGAGGALGEGLAAALGGGAGTQALAGLGGSILEGLVGSSRTGGSILGGASMGLQIGMQFGPQAAAIGAGVGAFVGFLSDMFSSVDRTFVNASNVQGRLVANVREHGGQMAEQTNDFIDSAIDTINSILDSLGAAFSDVSQSTLAVQFQDTDEGIKVWVNGVVRTFGENFEAALNFAITETLRQGDFVGLSPVARQALQSFTGSSVAQLQAALSDALAIEDLGVEPSFLPLRNAIREQLRLLSEAVRDFGAEGVPGITGGPGGIVATFRAAFDDLLGRTPDVAAQVEARFRAMQAEQIVLVAQLRAQLAMIEARASEVRLMTAAGGAFAGMLAVRDAELSATAAGLEAEAALAQGRAAGAIVAQGATQAQLEAMEALRQAIAEIESLPFGPAELEEAQAAARRAGAEARRSQREAEARQREQLQRQLEIDHMLAEGATEAEVEARRAEDALADFAQQLSDAGFDDAQIAMALLNRERIRERELAEEAAAALRELSEAISSTQEGARDALDRLRDLLEPGGPGPTEQFDEAVAAVEEQIAAFWERMQELVDAGAAATAANLLAEGMALQAELDALRARRDEFLAIAGQQSFRDIGTEALGMLDRYFERAQIGDQLRIQTLEATFQLERASLELRFRAAQAENLLSQAQIESIQQVLNFLATHTPDFSALARGSQTTGGSRRDGGRSPADAIADLREELERLLRTAEEADLGPAERELRSIYDDFQRIAEIMKTIGGDFGRAAELLTNRLGDFFERLFAPVDEARAQLRTDRSTPGQRFAEAQRAFLEARAGLPSDLSQLSADDLQRLVDVGNRFREEAQGLFGQGFGTSIVFQQLDDFFAQLQGLRPEREDLMRMAIEFLDAQQVIRHQDVQTGLGDTGSITSAVNQLDLRQARVQQLIDSISGPNGLKPSIKGDLTGPGISVREALIGAGGVLPALTGVGSIKEALTGARGIKDALTGTGGIKWSLTGTGGIKEALTGTGSVREALVGTGGIKQALTGSGGIKEALTGTGGLASLLSSGGPLEARMKNVEDAVNKLGVDLTDALTGITVTGL